MPIFEYSCRSCDTQFELLVRGEMTPACPDCQSEDLERLLSLPRVHSQSTRDLSKRAAKARDSRQAKERMETQRQYEESHDRHG
jgi:putative FmdB family regulatory protein